MDEKERDRCVVSVSSTVRMVYKKAGEHPSPPAEDTFDCEAAIKLNKEPGKASIQQYGQKLYDLLFLGDAERALARGFDRPEVKKQLIVEIVDQMSRELPGVSWEHLCTPEGLYLAVHDNFRFVRRLSRLGTKADPPLSRRPRVLVVVSSPGNLESGVEVAGVQHSFDAIEPPFRPEQTQLLDDLFRNLKENGQIADYGILSSSFPDGREDDPVYLSGLPTLNRIYQELEAAKKNQPYHIVHFLAHGHLDENDTGYLLLVDESGNADPIEESRFQALFPEGHGVRLVIFAACQSGGGEQKKGEPLSGLAPKLLELGIPAVIGMQEKITMDGAAIFTDIFYRQLAEHGYIDTAVWEARRALMRRPQDREWFIPVLYLQNENPRLFSPVDTLSARKLALDLFKEEPADKFVDRDSELEKFTDLLYEAPEPAIYWLQGPQMVGKYTLLEQLRFEAYRRGYGHLMVGDRRPGAMEGAGASVLRKLLYQMLVDRQLAQQPEVESCFQEFLKLQGRTQEPESLTTVVHFLDGLEKLAEKLERGLVCFFYFYDFRDHKEFLKGRPFQNLFHEADQRYKKHRLERVRFMLVTPIPDDTDLAGMFGGLAWSEFFSEEEQLSGLRGIDTLQKLCQCWNMSKDGQVPRQVLELVRKEPLWREKQEYLPGPPALLLLRLEKKLKRLAQRQGQAVTLDSVISDWVSPDAVGGGQ